MRPSQWTHGRTRASMRLSFGCMDARVRATTDYMFGDIHPEVASAISVATHGILEQHDGYDMRNLSQYVKITNGQVQEHIVPYIVLLATSAAWYVAHKFYVRERYMNSSQEHHQLMSESIANSMLGWFTGLRPERLVRSQSNTSTRSNNNKLDVHVTARRLSQSSGTINAQQVTYVTTSASCSKNQTDNVPEVCLAVDDESSESSVVIEQADIIPQSSVAIDVEPVTAVIPIADSSDSQINNTSVVISKLCDGSSVLPVHVEQTLSAISSDLARKEINIDSIPLPAVRIGDESICEISSVPSWDSQR